MQFYDWENNVCQQLDWLQKGNFASQMESDSIPAQLKSSRRAQQFEPESPVDNVQLCFCAPFVCAVVFVHCARQNVIVSGSASLVRIQFFWDHYACADVLRAFAIVHMYT